MGIYETMAIQIDSMDAAELVFVELLMAKGIQL